MLVSPSCADIQRAMRGVERARVMLLARIERLKMEVERAMRASAETRSLDQDARRESAGLADAVRREWSRV